MKAKRKLILNDLVWIVAGPSLFFAGIYVSSWFFIGLACLLIGPKLCQIDKRFGFRRHFHKESMAREVKEEFI